MISLLATTVLILSTFRCQTHFLDKCIRTPPPPGVTRVLVLINPPGVDVSRVAQEAYLEIEYIRNVLSVSGTLKYADSGTA